MSADEVQALVSLLAGLRQDSIISDMEGVLATTQEYREIPAPMTSHPAFSHAADFVRHFDRDNVVVRDSPATPSFMVSESKFEPTDIAMRREVLSREKAFGGAPFVGDPLIEKAVYVWSVWRDNRGRWISGDSKLVYLPRFGG